MTPRPAPKRLCFSSLSCASRNKVGLFRCVKNWIVQFGIAGDPAVGRKWRAAGSVRDDPQWLPADGDPEARFKRGLLSFAGAGANSRATEMFLAFKVPSAYYYYYLSSYYYYCVLDSDYSTPPRARAQGHRARRRAARGAVRARRRRRRRLRDDGPVVSARFASRAGARAPTPEDAPS